jgi:hypothetical protein
MIRGAGALLYICISEFKQFLTQLAVRCSILLAGGCFPRISQN